MAKFEYYIDQKETMWRRNYCVIDAETEEEAILKIRSSAFDVDYDMNIKSSIIIEETCDDMDYLENYNQPTREVYYNNKLVEDNTPLQIKREIKINNIINE